MPLSTPPSREFLTRRTISCEGFERPDGLMDIDGHLKDVRGFDMDNDWRKLPAGQPVHEMWVRLTLDDQLVIRAVECAMDAAPYGICREVVPNLQRLTGVRISGGFKKEMRARVGNTEGCTHIVALLDCMSTVAVQALAATRRNEDRETILGTFTTRPGERPGLIGSCRSYAADSPVVEKYWPMYYQPRKPTDPT
jgi:hypothetical protein